MKICPQIIFSNRNKNTSLFSKVKKTALVNIIYGWPQGNLCFINHLCMTLWLRIVPKIIFSNRNKNTYLFSAVKETSKVNIIYGWPQGNLWHESIKVLLTSFMYIPKVIFSNKNTNICLFGTVKENALTLQWLKKQTGQGVIYEVYYYCKCSLFHGTK